MGESAIIVTDDYLCYKKPKSPHNFFILIFKFETFGGIATKNTGSSSLDCKDINL